ncbi:MAG: adaptin domain-containing protein [Myxococcota bacterium]|nr:adaptin domain-containing protein [Myxococcota bacterium]MDW8361398.1 hypothetical protein [Myxococcales bacterium]
MGLLERLGLRGSFARHAARVANRRALAPDRWDSIQALARMGTPDAARALLARFTYRIDPSITDQEEKEAAFEAVVSVGAPIVPDVRALLRTCPSVSWPLKILDRLLPAEEVVTEILALLESMGTEYERNPDRKVELIAHLRDRRDPRIAPATIRFLEDANETVRFHALATVLAQDDVEAHCDTLIERLLVEDSVRVRILLLESLRDRNWALPEDRREALRARLPTGWALDAHGVPRGA